ncbi:MAG: hypothetical protein RR311_02275 [Comamonas sp.]
MAEHLGVLPDEQVAQLAGKSSAAVTALRKRKGLHGVRRLRWCDGYLAELGTKPDSQIASLYGVGITTVAMLRKMHGIPASTKRRAWQPQELEMLGKFSDSEVARRIGRTRSAVAIERRDRRIAGIDPRDATRLYNQYRQSA